MNRMIFSFSFLLILGTANAQKPEFLQGTFTVGGNFAHSESDITFTTGLGGKGERSETVLTSSFSYFVIQQAELSISFGYIYTKPGVIYKQAAFGVGARYYQPVVDRVSIYGGGAFNYLVYLSGIGRAYTIEGGINIFVASAFAVEPGFQSIKTKNYFSEVSGTRFIIGVRYFFF